MIYATKRNNGNYRIHEKDQDEEGYGFYYTDIKRFAPALRTYTAKELRAIADKLDELEK